MKVLKSVFAPNSLCFIGAVAVLAGACRPGQVISPSSGDETPWVNDDGGAFDDLPDDSGYGPSPDAGAADSGNSSISSPVSGSDSGSASEGRRDSGTAPTSDAGTAPTSDAGTAPTSDAGTVPTSDAAVGTKPDLPPNLPPATGAPGVWENVTSPQMDRSLFTGTNGFGVGNIVADPAHPTDLYAGGQGSLWKSTDYGLTWKKLDSKPNPAPLALGHVLAVAGTTPATLWMANVTGPKYVYKSIDAGLTFRLTGTIVDGTDAANFYSIVVDPYNPNHLLTGLHEQDRVLESTDGGETWKFVSGSGWPSGGRSWFPFFIDTGAATTAKTWFAIAQDGASAIRTTDGGKTWSVPSGLQGLQHPHGGANLFQTGNSLFVAGMQGPGDGVYRSTDLGERFTRIVQGSGALVWGSTKSLHAMWGWACASCGLDAGGPHWQTSAMPGDGGWTMPKLPAGLVWGPNSVATTTDGKHTIFVGSMWSNGLWRYVEP